MKFDWPKTTAMSCSAARSGCAGRTFQNSKLAIGSAVNSRPEVFRITILRRSPNDEK